MKKNIEPRRSSVFDENGNIPVFARSDIEASDIRKTFQRMIVELKGEILNPGLATDPQEVCEILQTVIHASSVELPKVNFSHEKMADERQEGSILQSFSEGAAFADQLASDYPQYFTCLQGVLRKYKRALNAHRFDDRNYHNSFNKRSGLSVLNFSKLEGTTIYTDEITNWSVTIAQTFLLGMSERVEQLAVEISKRIIESRATIDAASYLHPFVKIAVALNDIFANSSEQGSGQIGTIFINRLLKSFNVSNPTLAMLHADEFTVDDLLQIADNCDVSVDELALSEQCRRLLWAQDVGTFDLLRDLDRYDEDFELISAALAAPRESITSKDAELIERIKRVNAEVINFDSGSPFSKVTKFINILLEEAQNFTPTPPPEMIPLHLADEGEKWPKGITHWEMSALIDPSEHVKEQLLVAQLILNEDEWSRYLQTLTAYLRKEQGMLTEILDRHLETRELLRQMARDTLVAEIPNRIPFWFYTLLKSDLLAEAMRLQRIRLIIGNELLTDAEWEKVDYVLKVKILERALGQVDFDL